MRGNSPSRRALLLGLALALASALPASGAETGGPGQGTAAMPAAVRGNPKAPKEGLRRERAPVQPATLHPLNATDLYANIILDVIYETLATLDVETIAHVPLLARAWETAPDRSSYTFRLDPRARWQDGSPVTAGDVKASFDLLFDPKLRTRAKWMSYYSNIERAEPLDAHTVRFTVKRDHFLNFVHLAGLRIVPLSGFAGVEPDKAALARRPMGSGPYRFVSWQKGSALRLERDPRYWGRDLPQNLGRYNERMRLTKFINADKVALEALKKGDLDVLTLTPEQWVRETDGAEFGPPGSDSRLIKLDVRNEAPRTYRYVGWNLESPLFSDRRVRRALAHLFDRKTFAEKFYHGMQEPAVGPFEVNSRYSSPRVRPIPFSIPDALELLAEAGWRDRDGDGVLDKDGRPFRFTVMTADPEISVKMLTLTKETMRKAGIVLDIKVMDWTSFLALIDEFKFDAVMLGWSRDFFSDPTALWHSASAVRGGLNFVHYRNPAVDRLIEQGVRSIPDAERIPIFRRIHELIYEDQPYAFLLEPTSTLLAYNARIHMLKPWYRFDTGMDYWWSERVVP
ncbi:MAG: hypothetical protein HY423_11280 [Candidatus Lambdaproteobacteria bacterium]|nr:hypothetical protein [Candidatus Lambdaproteobacteria bacterium]